MIPHNGWSLIEKDSVWAKVEVTDQMWINAIMLTHPDWIQYEIDQ
jgi:hypothetical protein